LPGQLDRVIRDALLIFRAPDNGLIAEDLTVYAFPQMWGSTALGAKITGLPIDFQIQPMSVANARWGLPEHHRQAIGCVELRYGKPVESKS
jgi:hypothetical protein